MHHFAYHLSNRYPCTSCDAHRNDPQAPRVRCKSHFQVLSHHVFTSLDAEQAVLDVLAKTLADVSTQLGHRSFVDPKVRATWPRASSCPSYPSLSGPTTRERLANRLQKNIRRDPRNEGFSPALGERFPEAEGTDTSLVQEAGEESARAKECSVLSFALAVSICNSPTISVNAPMSSSTTCIALMLHRMLLIKREAGP